MPINNLRNIFYRAIKNVFITNPLIAFIDTPMLSYAICNELNNQLLPQCHSHFSLLLSHYRVFILTGILIGILNLIIRFDTI